jgi:polysaccharide pyruvyl transferase WcaK-like protein
LMRLIANRVDLITLRDEDSRQFLYKLGVTCPPVIVTADPVFSLEPEESDQTIIKNLLSALGIANSPMVGVAVRKWQALEGYQTRLAKLLDDLAARGYQIVFVPMAYPDDILESRVIAKLMHHNSIVIDKHLNSREHLALIAHLDLMIAMRLHALVFAASRGVPFAGISYDPKVDAFLKLFGLSPLAEDWIEMKSQVDQLLNDVSIQNTISRRALDLRSKSEQNAQLALSLIK